MMIINHFGGNMSFSLLFFSIFACRTDSDGFSSLGQTSLDPNSMNQGQGDPNDTGKPDDNQETSVPPTITGIDASFTNAGGQGYIIEVFVFYSDQDNDVASCVGTTPSGKSCLVEVSYSTEVGETGTEEIDLSPVNNVQFDVDEFNFNLQEPATETHTLNIILYDSAGNSSNSFEAIAAFPPS